MKDRKALETNSDVGTRTIVIYWAFLVLLNHICIWQQAAFGAKDNNTENPDMTKSCAAQGQLPAYLRIRTELSTKGPSTLPSFKIMAVLICANLVNIPSIFRNQNELVLLKHSEAILWNDILSGTRYQKAKRLMTAENKAFNINYYSLPFILVQGFIVALFGRRDSREIRDVI